MSKDKENEKPNLIQEYREDGYAGIPRTCKIKRLKPIF